MEGAKAGGGQHGSCTLIDIYSIRTTSKLMSDLSEMTLMGGQISVLVFCWSVRRLAELSQTPHIDRFSQKAALLHIAWSRSEKAHTTVLPGDFLNTSHSYK